MSCGERIARGGLPLTSHLGRGLPNSARNAMRERTAQSASAQEEPASEPTRVLVVEDYDSTREALAGALEEAGFRVDVAVSGREAIAKAILEQPDVILMDLSLP